MSTIHTPLYYKQQIIDNCKYLFGNDIDPVILTEKYDGVVWENTSFNGKMCSIKHSHTGFRAIVVVDSLNIDTSFFSTTDVDRQALCYSSPLKDAVYLRSRDASKPCHIGPGVSYAMEDLHRLTAELVKDKFDQGVLLNKSLQAGVEEKLQRLIAGTDVDVTIKEGLRQKLYQRARESVERKEEKRQNKISRKIQDMLDTLEDTDDDEDDDNEATMDQFFLRVQQPSKDLRSKNEIDWCAAYVSNIVKDCQRKYREKLKKQKEELTKKFEEEVEVAVKEAKDVADQKLARIQLEHESVTETYDEKFER
ncbi:hypothetical protein BZA77DRAFT_347793 [Pyronema omphalodes]|nr:hypothetical protein BZA77DRAFT_347793 [Pyronema omphalodes]